jgi:hypothetical protein
MPARTNRDGTTGWGARGRQPSSALHESASSLTTGVTPWDLPFLPQSALRGPAVRMRLRRSENFLIIMRIVAPGETECDLRG